MAPKITGLIEIPDTTGVLFDHGAFEPATRRVFVATTGRDRVDVIDHDAGRHVAALPGFPEAAGVVAENGQVLVTNRGSASLAWLDARTLETRAVLKTGPRPNGVALIAASRLAIVACIGDDTSPPTLEAMRLGDTARWSIELPGRPRWCVTDAGGTRVFLAIREPSMVLSARLPTLAGVDHLPLPSHGAHGMDIDHAAGLLYVACDGGELIEMDVAGRLRRRWPLPGVPDATFFNPASRLVHVAVAEPGVVQSTDVSTGESAQCATSLGAKTTAFVPPDRLYVFSPEHGGALVLSDA
jgi:DNA-binding beta-propeller fold protein YncE